MSVQKDLQTVKATQSVGTQLVPLSVFSPRRTEMSVQMAPTPAALMLTARTGKMATLAAAGLDSPEMETPAQVD